MSTSVTFNGVSYTVPAIADASWGTNVSNYLIAIATGSLQKTGGAFTLSTADVDFGGTYGLKALYFKTKTANLSSAGVLRLAVADSVGWRNNANGGDLLLAVDGSDRLTFNGAVINIVGTLITPSQGGTGVANNNASTLTISGNFGTTFTVTGATTLTLPTTGTLAATSNKLSIFAATTSAELAGVISDESGTGLLVFNNTPTLITPVLGVATATSINKVTFTAPATSAVLTIADGKTFTASNTLAFTGTDSTSFAFPSVSGTVVTLAGVQALTAKDYQGGTASNTSRLTVPSATKATLDGLTRKAATIVYGTDTTTLYADNGSSLVPVGSGGTGQINVILNPNDNYATWATTASGPTATTTLTAGNLPLNSVVGITTAIQLTSNSAAQTEASNYFGYAFTTPQTFNQKQSISFWMVPGSNFIANEWTVSIYAGATRQTLSTDSSGVTYLPSLTGKFTTTFDASASTAYTLRFARPVNAGLNAGVLNVNSIVVGPGTQPQGGAIGPTTSWTPTFGAGFGTATAVAFQFDRVGDFIIGTGTLTAGTVAGSASTFTLPNSWLANETKVCGRWTRVNASATTRKMGDLYSTASGNTIAFCSDDYTTAAGPTTTLNGNAFLSNSDVIFVQFQLVIADLIGSGTVNVVQNDIEYAFNTSSSTSGSDSTSFGYGPGGALIRSITTGLLRTVQFQTPIQATDSVILEMWSGVAGDAWLPVAGLADNANGFPLTFSAQNVTHYGLGLRASTGNSYQVIVQFGDYAIPTGTTFGSAGQAWSAVLGAFFWRCRKVKGGQAIGFGNVQQSVSGLVKSAGQLLGTNTNDVAATGYVGEMLGPISRIRSNSTTLTSGVVVNVGTTTSITLTPGDWQVSGMIGFTPAATTTVTELDAAVSATSATLPASDTLAVPTNGEVYITFGMHSGSVPVNDMTMQICAYQVTVAAGATKQLFLVATGSFGTSTLKVYGSLQARRMR